MSKLVILVMGVSGSGKSTLGAALAADLGWPFLEGDRFHPPENIAKMAAGIPLYDADRAPWLARLRAEIESQLRAQNGGGTVLACSALKASYRRQLRGGIEARVPLVYLKGDPSGLEDRLRGRSGHYMKVDMLDSQLEVLEEPEPPERAVTIPFDLPTGEAVRLIRRALGLD
jgi:gluconokinase